MNKVIYVLLTYSLYMYIYIYNIIVLYCNSMLLKLKAGIGKCLKL